MTKNRVSGERLFASLNILLLHKDDRADDDDDDDDGDDENDDDDDDDDDDDYNYDSDDVSTLSKDLHYGRGKRCDFQPPRQPSH